MVVLYYARREKFVLFSILSLCVYLLWSFVVRTKCGFYMFGEKKEEAQYMPEARSVEVCFGAQKQKKHTPPSNLSFHLSFRPTAFVRSCEPQNWSVFFPFFAYFQACRTRNSSFLKHRIHPKHGSGRTSSLTRSNTRKCISSSFYFVFSFVEFFFTRAKLSSLFFLSV